jgi:signal-transduction protein with cAMP-binding, CBS, and nucleotidyltransferase domain
MKVRDFTWREPVTIEVDATITEAAERFLQEGVGALIVLDRGRPVGIVTDRDLVVRGVANRMAPDGRVDSLMSMGVVALDADADVGDLYSVFSLHAIRRVPVVDHDRVVGMVSLDDVMVTMSAQLNDLAGVLSTQIAFPHARDERSRPVAME